MRISNLKTLYLNILYKQESWLLSMLLDKFRNEVMKYPFNLLNHNNLSKDLLLIQFYIFNKSTIIDRQWSGVLQVLGVI